MDIEFITEDECAACVVENVNKTNGGISSLQRQIIEMMNKHPEFDIVEIRRKMSVDMLNTFEISSKEAAYTIYQKERKYREN